MNITRSIITGLALLSAWGCSEPPVDAARDRSPARTELRTWSADAGGTPPELIARPCRADGFFVEVPTEYHPLWPDNRFLSNFEGALEKLVNAGTRPWFCGAGAISCPVGNITVQATSILPQRSEPAYRADGHLRFYRVYFTEQATGEVLSVRPGAQCAAVESIRAEFVMASGGDADGIYVGRECDALGLDIQQESTDAMRTWHLDRLGIASAAGATSGDLVDVALIDSGVVTALHAPLGVATETMYVSDPNLDVHGTAMATLIDQLAPDARIASYRVIASDATTPSGALAQAVEQAVFSTLPRRPMVLNLSLGFPNPLGRHAGLTGEGGCATNEGPIGESLRYALYMARRLEEDGRYIFVSAAAGNRPMEVDPSLFPAPIEPYVELAGCGAQSFATTPWFYPAWWNHLDSCMEGDPVNRRLAFGVSVVDDRDRASVVTPPFGEAPFVAPGQHVYAAHDYAPAGPTGPWCAEPPPQPWAPRLPAAMTGTSVGAALVTGAVARAQATRIVQGQPLLSSSTLERLLYLSGLPVCRSTAEGIAVRRLSVGRLDHVLTTPGCNAVVACAAGGTGIGSGLLAACAPALDACGIGAGTCPSPAAVPWPAGYEDEPACGHTVVATTLYDRSTCGPLCPTPTAPLREMMGSLGPAPNTPACPDCAVYYDPTESRPGLMVIEWSAALEPGTTLTDPYLTVIDQLTQNAYDVPLDGVSTEPGTATKVLVPTHDMEVDWNAVIATLTVTVASPENKPVTVVDPLRVLSY